MRDVRKRRDFTKEELLNVLGYDENSGIFFWKIKVKGHAGYRYPGDTAGTVKDGYCAIFVFGKQYRAHHLAYLFMVGEWPSINTDIDHKNGNRFDNSWGNLRIATRTQNNMNMNLRKDNKSGHKGVGQRKDTGQWYARIKCTNRLILLGHFKDKADAVKARDAAEIKYFGAYSDKQRGLQNAISKN